MRFSLFLALLLTPAAAQDGGNYYDLTVPGAFDITESYPGLFVVENGPDQGTWIAGLPSGSGVTAWTDTLALCRGFRGVLLHVRDSGPEQDPGGEACTEDLPILNDLTGKIALVRRGVCEFANKAFNVQTASAVGFVIYNDERVQPPDDTTLLNMGGDVSSQVTIPGLFIGARLGRDLAWQVASGQPVEVTLGVRDDVDVDTDGNGFPDAQVPVYRCDDVGAAAAPPTPAGLALTIAPNPVRDAAAVTLAFDAPRAVRVAVYDVLGREVAVLHDGPAAADLRLALDASRLAPGIYVVRAAGEGLAASRPLTVVR